MRCPRNVLKIIVLQISIGSAVVAWGETNPAEQTPTVSQAGYEQPVNSPENWQLGADPFDVERGNPNVLVDGIGWVIGIPEKVLLWNSEVINHHISAQTEAELTEYLRANEIDEVKVRINQYAPLDEWRRLRQNKKVGAGWRYTIGALATLGYTILPGRLVGADAYNPYTNSIYIYSDVPALALEQAAYAKDVRSRHNPGTYATSQLLPIWGLKHEHQSKQDVYEYLGENSSPAELAEAQKVLQPQFGMEVGGGVGAFAQPLQPVFQIAGAGVGHVVGHRKVQQLSTEK